MPLPTDEVPEGTEAIQNEVFCVRDQFGSAAQV